MQDNEIREHFITILSGYGFREEDIDVDFDEKSNNVIIKLRKFSAGNPTENFVTLQLPIDQELKIVRSSKSKNIFGTVMKMYSYDKEKLTDLLKEAGVTEYVIDGKYKVISISYDSAVKKVASSIKYPYKTSDNVVLQNPYQFIHNFTVGQEYKNKVSSSIVYGMAGTEKSKNVVYDEDNANWVDFLTGASSLDAISQLSKQIDKRRKELKSTERYKKEVDEMIEKSIPELEEINYVYDPEGDREVKLASFVCSVYASKLNEWGLDPKEYNLEVIPLGIEDKDTASYNYSVRFNKGDIFLNSIETLSVDEENNIVIKGALLDRLADILDVKEYEIEGIGKVEATVDNQFLTKVESLYGKLVLSDIEEGNRKVKIRRKIRSDLKDSSTTFWRVVLDEDGTAYLERVEE